MTIKEKFENHPVVFCFILIITAFCAGYKAYPILTHTTSKANERPSVQTTKKAKNCTKLEELIKRKTLEIQEQEKKVAMASPISFGNKKKDPNSLYNRRIRELKALQSQKDMATQKLIECLSN